MSSISQPCERKLYYEINHSEHGEKFEAATYTKFLFGDILESLLLFLAEESGHSVTGRQDTLEIAGIIGHRDGIIDGTLVDCKSASSYSFTKFKEGLTPEGDGFGYLGQLRNYVLASKDDPLVTDKRRGAFFVIDKSLGHLCLDIHSFEDTGIHEEFERKKFLVASGDLPDRAYTPEPMGKSGNMKIPFNCAYCPFKNLCYTNLRQFIYSSGPVWLSEVKDVPRVYEVNAPDA